MIKNQSLIIHQAGRLDDFVWQKTLVFYLYILKIFIMFVIHKVKDVCGKTFLKKIWKKRKTIISLYPKLNHLTFNSETT